MISSEEKKKEIEIWIMERKTIKLVLEQSYCYITFVLI